LNTISNQIRAQSSNQKLIQDTTNSNNCDEKKHHNLKNKNL